jgi:altronate hydrolase
MNSIIINDLDNVSVSLDDFHKYARRNIKKGEKIIKYGFPIGVATEDIGCGEKVHTNNLKTALSSVEEYIYTPCDIQPDGETADVFINAFVRKNNEIGIRNDIWIIPTVGCVNKVAEKLASLTGAFCFTHPYGCSQLGEDSLRTVKTLCSLIKHPNAGGVLVVGLGCENNNISVIKENLGEYDGERIRFLNVQDYDDEISEGVNIIEMLKEKAASDERTPVSISELKIGLKCGGSDGLSGITANPTVGKVTDTICAQGGSAVLTEVPEMFGAEQILLNRCESKAVFDKAVEMINAYKNYFISHNQPISENPSPGNKEGGITTLEEKSLGCVQKGGNAVVTDVLDYGDRVSKKGLSLLNGPGNDMVAVTNLTAAGCHLILFTTGRGTPLGAPVPTIKIASNTKLADSKKGWIDFDAQKQTPSDLINLLINVANGSQTKNEKNGYREIAIFKDGVTL